jgi:hypothetical protein
MLFDASMDEVFVLERTHPSESRSRRTIVIT